MPPDAHGNAGAETVVVKSRNASPTGGVERIVNEGPFGERGCLQENRRNGGNGWPGQGTVRLHREQVAENLCVFGKGREQCIWTRQPWCKRPAGSGAARNCFLKCLHDCFRQPEAAITPRYYLCAEDPFFDSAKRCPSHPTAAFAIIVNPFRGNCSDTSPAAINNIPAAPNATQCVPNRSYPHPPSHALIIPPIWCPT
jgi:hypothetical protein